MDPSVISEGHGGRPAPGPQTLTNIYQPTRGKPKKKNTDVTWISLPRVVGLNPWLLHFWLTKLQPVSMMHERNKRENQKRLQSGTSISNFFFFFFVLNWSNGKQEKSKRGKKIKLSRNVTLGFNIL